MDTLDGIKWKLSESVRKRNNIFTASPLRPRHFQNLRVDTVHRRIRIRMREAQKVTGTLIKFHTCIVNTVSIYIFFNLFLGDQALI